MTDAPVWWPSWLHPGWATPLRWFKRKPRMVYEEFLTEAERESLDDDDIEDLIKRAKHLDRTVKKKEIERRKVEPPVYPQQILSVRPHLSVPEWTRQTPTTISGFSTMQDMRHVLAAIQCVIEVEGEIPKQYSKVFARGNSIYIVLEFARRQFAQQISIQEMYCVPSDVRPEWIMERTQEIRDKFFEHVLSSGMGFASRSASP